MAIFDIGRLCVKKFGRETGNQCVVVDVVDKNFVLVTGPKDITGVRRRRSNVDHLEPTETIVDIKKGASDDQVKNALKKAGVITEIPEPRPPREKASKVEEKKEEKPKKKAPAKKRKAKEESEES